MDKVRAGCVEEPHVMAWRHLAGGMKPRIQVPQEKWTGRAEGGTSHDAGGKNLSLVQL